MKIGLVTYFRENYGSSLQCFATKKYLESCGYRIQVLERRERSGYKFLLRLSNVIKHGIKSLRYRGYSKHYFEIKRAMRREKGFLSQKSKKCIDQFIDESIQPIKMSWRELKRVFKTDEFTACICGSDQIWNPSIGIIDPFYLLRFCDKEKKIAFAPSFGTEYIPDFNVKDLKNAIQDFRRLSVREESGVKLVNQLINIECMRLPDPVFLLKKEQWLEVTKSVPLIKGRYAFIYFLNEPKTYVIEEINKICREKSLKPILFSHKYEKYNEIINASFYFGSPIDFLNLIFFSNMILTDSFHASAFSIIFEKCFLCFERNHLHKSNQGNRIIDMLNRYDILSRYITSSNDIKMAIDYDMQSLICITNNERNIVRQYLFQELDRVTGENT